MDFRINGNMPVDIMLHDGRTSAGFKIMIDSAKKIISLSDGGGTSVSRPDTKQYDLPNLKQGVWCTLEITDLQLSEERNPPVVGRLYLYERGQLAKLLLDDVAIQSAGMAAHRPDVRYDHTAHGRQAREPMRPGASHHQSYAHDWAVTLSLRHQVLVGVKDRNPNQPPLSGWSVCSSST